MLSMCVENRAWPTFACDTAFENESFWVTTSPLTESIFETDRASIRAKDVGDVSAAPGSQFGKFFPCSVHNYTWLVISE